MKFLLLSAILAAAVTGAAFLMPAPEALAAGAPRFSVIPEPVDRGGVGRVEISEWTDPASLAGEFDGRPIMFSEFGGGRIIGFFGVDVMLSPGRYPLRLSWPGGENSVEINVRDHAYGRRSIKVPQNQVDLSEADQKRAAAEKILTDRALAAKSPARLWKAAFLDPAPGKVNSSFGRQTVINGVLSPRPHAGADYLVGTGTAVKAPADGIVLLADFHFFAGGSVYIDHGQGLISMYFHLSELKVKAGEPVQRGQVIAASGGTGRVTGAHLHYGVYLCGARIDPVVFQKMTTGLFK